MVDIPSFFKKPDFYGVLLPGYLAVTLYLLLFQPGLLFPSPEPLSIDLFSAVVFVIFGPAVGLGLQQFHRRLAIVVAQLWDGGAPPLPPAPPPTNAPRPAGAPILPSRLVPPHHRDLGYYDSYAYARLNATEREEFELDLAESQYDFSMSSGIALAGLGLYRFVLKGSVDFGISAALIIVGIIFLVGGYVEWKRGYLPVINQLLARHP